MDLKTIPIKRLSTEESATFDRSTIDYIKKAAAHGLY